MNTGISGGSKLKIERLGFELPEFPVRISWTSQWRKEIWGERIKSINRAWEVVERKRPSSLQFIGVNSLADLVKECSNHGKVVIPLRKEGITEGYGNSKEYEEGQPFHYRVAITDVEHVKDWSGPLSDITMGRLLGYPDCCVDFFIKYWKREKYLDLTWLEALNSLYSSVMIGEEFLRTVTITREPHLNLLLRWLGIRLTSHMPCSFQCKESILIARSNWANFPEKERAWIEELLALPTTWSAKHGIAEVKTPWFRFIARTDATGEEYRVILNGVEKKEEDTWTDNGFPSKDAMDDAHEKLLAIAGKYLTGTVLDLGCGNGELLRKLGPGVIKLGVEIDPNKTKRSNFVASVHNSDINAFKWDRRYDAILISYNRIIESYDKESLLDHLYRSTNKLILYSYNEDLPSLSLFLKKWKPIVGNSKISVLVHD